MFVLTKLNARTIKKHYRARLKIHELLTSLHDARKYKQYAELALGITDPAGNYSAAEHGLGPRILETSTTRTIWILAQSLRACTTATEVTNAIYQANIDYLKISVGSEMAMMLQPKTFWVGNTRTIWTHLVYKHNGDYRKADYELSLYHDRERPSEMDYAVWKDIYLSMKSNLDSISTTANRWAIAHKIAPGKRKYLWVDAICNGLYAEHQ